MGSGDDVVTGAASGDQIEGRDGDDVLSGAGGSDRIDGGAGDDRLDGGDGFDTLSYSTAAAGVQFDFALVGQAQDTVGAGVDTVTGFEQVDGSRYSDRILGSGGSDYMTGGIGGSDRLIGGAGNDHIALYHLAADTPVKSLLSGGAGDDVLTVGAPAGVADRIVVRAGGGSDFAFLQVAAHQSVEMGGGEDRVVLQFGDGDVAIALGRGVDTVAFQLVSGFSAQQSAAHVTDFAAGENGDRIDLRDLLAGAAPDYVPGTNPFATGFVRLVESDTGTSLQFDADADGSAAAFVTVLELDGTRPDDFTAFNFGGTDPNAGLTAPPTRDDHWPALEQLA